MHFEFAGVMVDGVVAVCVDDGGGNVKVESDAFQRSTHQRKTCFPAGFFA